MASRGVSSLIPTPMKAKYEYLQREWTIDSPILGTKDPAVEAVEIEVEQKEVDVYDEGADQQHYTEEQNQEYYYGQEEGGYQYDQYNQEGYDYENEGYTDENGNYQYYESKDAEDPAFPAAESFITTVASDLFQMFALSDAIGFEELKSMLSFCMKTQSQFDTDERKSSTPMKDADVSEQELQTIMGSIAQGDKSATKDHLCQFVEKGLADWKDLSIEQREFFAERSSAHKKLNIIFEYCDDQVRKMEKKLQTQQPSDLLAEMKQCKAMSKKHVTPSPKRKKPVLGERNPNGPTQTIDPISFTSPDNKENVSQNVNKSPAAQKSAGKSRVRFVSPPAEKKVQPLASGDANTPVAATKESAPVDELSQKQKHVKTAPRVCPTPKRVTGQKANHSISMAGYLMKMRKTNDNNGKNMTLKTPDMVKSECWNKRWFAIKDGYITYSKTNASAKPSGWLPLCKVTTVMMKSKFGSTFLVKSSTRTFILRAKTATDSLSWVHTIASAASQCQDKPIKEFLKKEEKSDKKKSSPDDLPGQIDEKGAKVEKQEKRVLSPTAQLFMMKKAEIDMTEKLEEAKQKRAPSDTSKVNEGDVPAGWELCTDAEGNNYYYNETTWESVWTVEEANESDERTQQAAQGNAGVDEDDAFTQDADEFPYDECQGKDGDVQQESKYGEGVWEECYDDDGNKYFYNSVTADSVWTQEECY